MQSPTRRPFRYRVHMVAYGIVAGSLIIMGVIFTGFALFEQRSMISKVWLAGPTTLAVGLVLFGKVIIDYKPINTEVEMENNAQFIEMQQMKEVFVAQASKNPFQLSQNEKKTVKYESSQCDCDVWHLRDESMSDYPSLCLNNTTTSKSTTTNTTGDSCQRELLQHSDSTSTFHQIPNMHYSKSFISTTSTTLNSTTPENVMIYQGETFVFNDRQYLI